jgi:hypothetical protein
MEIISALQGLLTDRVIGIALEYYSRATILRILLRQSRIPETPTPAKTVPLVVYMPPLLPLGSGPRNRLCKRCKRRWKEQLRRRRVIEKAATSTRQFEHKNEPGRRTAICKSIGVALMDFCKKRQHEDDSGTRLDDWGLL